MSAVELTAFKVNGKSSKTEGQTFANAMKEGTLEKDSSSVQTDIVHQGSAMDEKNLIKNEDPQDVPQESIEDPNTVFGKTENSAISKDFEGAGAKVIANLGSVEDSLVEQVKLSWRKVDVFANTNRGSLCKRLCCKRNSDEPQIKQILFDVNGEVKPGTLLAVMGASGAGKSTLMNVLAHRNLGKLQVSGEVKVNEETVGLDINFISAYVQQEDLFIGTLTVREHLTFNALLRMGKHVSKERKLQRVEEVITELGLTKCADTVIGIPGRISGISGGERKRLSFASEVLNNPPLLFADEPTSGLDAFMAQSIISALQRQAANGHTIICTIHQPSSEVYAMFDSILLMAEGRVAYLGPAKEAIPHFARYGYECPRNFNPADYFVQTLAIVPGREEECKERVKALCDAYEDEVKQKIDSSDIKRQNSFKDDVHIVQKSTYKASWWTQFQAVLWRSWVSNMRDVIITRIRLIQNIVIGIIAGLIYFQIKYNQDGVQNIAGALFFLVTNLSFGSLQGVIFVFPAELPVFLREHKNGLYRTDVYYLSKTLAELPIFLLGPLLLFGISYWMIGLRYTDYGWHFLVCYLLAVLITNVALSYGYLISTMVDSVTAASAIAAPLMLPLLIFGGFFLKDNSVPVYFIWLKYISWFKYGFEALIINQWKDYPHIACDRNTTILNLGRNGTIANRGAGCIINGNEAIKFLSFDKDHLLIDIYALLGLMVGFRIISYLFLLRRANKRQ